MRVLVDRHHGVLHEALAILFEDRFGWELRAWVDGYHLSQPGPVVCDFPPRTLTAMTTEQVIADPPDLIISTVDRNRHAMSDLAAKVGARYVDHVGNAWDGPIGNRTLRSVAGSYGQLYHPEFHRVPYTEPTGKRIGAFHGSLATSLCRPLFDKAKELFPEWEFRLYGTVEDSLYPWQVADAMSECAVIWHDKDADGYGFTVHEAFASGRPVVGHDHYRGKLAQDLWIEGVTSLDLGPEKLAGLLSDRGRITAMGLQARARFESLVDFDAEAEQIHDFLSIPVAA